MITSRLLVSVVVAFAATAASAQNTGSKLPDYAKTPTELSAVQPTGGAGGSGNPGVQVITILGDASKAGVYAQLLKVATGAEIPAHHHAGDRIGTVLQAPGTSAVATNSTRAS
jgi:quercetin dioxygenase-like cupin family protein